MTTLLVRCVTCAPLAAAVLATPSLSAETYQSAQHALRVTDCWEMRALDTFGGTFSLAFDLNDSGQVIGIARTSDDSVKAYITAPNGGALTAIDPPDTFQVLSPIAINNSGQVVGTLQQMNVGTSSFVTDAGGVNPRPTIRYAYARDINNVGQTLWDVYLPFQKAVIGPSEQPPNSDGVGLIEVDVLPDVDPAERFIQSTSLNDLGQVAVTGYRSPIVPNDPGTLPVAYRWSTFEGAIVLGPPDATYSNAFDINNSGQVTGNVNRDGVDQAYATRRNSVELQMLGTPGDGNFPGGLNNYSQITGTYFLQDGSSFAYVTPPFRIHQHIRINTLREVVRDGWTLVEAHAINNRGQVAGYGVFNGDYRAFLLTPLSPMAYLPTRDGTQPTCYRVAHP